MKSLCASGVPLEHWFGLFKSEKFAIIPDETKQTIYILYQENVSAEEMLQSYYIAVLSAMTVTSRVSWLDRSTGRNKIGYVLEETFSEKSWLAFGQSLKDKGLID